MLSRMNTSAPIPYGSAAIRSDITSFVSAKSTNNAVPNAPRKPVSSNSRVNKMNVKNRMMLPSELFEEHSNNSNNNARPVNIGNVMRLTNFREHPKAVLNSGYVTPNRKTTNPFGKYGNLPGEPPKLSRRIQYTNRKNTNRKNTRRRKRV